MYLFIMLLHALPRMHTQLKCIIASAMLCRWRHSLLTITLSFSQDVTGVMLLRKRVSEPWFTLISAGVKQVEGRLDRGGGFARIQTGDVIVWENDDLGFTRTCRTRVEGRTKYSAFRAYLQREHLSRCLRAAGIKTIDQGVRVILSGYDFWQLEIPVSQGLQCGG